MRKLKNWEIEIVKNGKIGKLESRKLKQLNN